MNGESCRPVFSGRESTEKRMMGKLLDTPAIHRVNGRQNVSSPGSGWYLPISFPINRPKTTSPQGRSRIAHNTLKNKLSMRLTSLSRRALRRVQNPDHYSSFSTIQPGWSAIRQLESSYEEEKAKSDDRCEHRQRVKKTRYWATSRD